MAIRELNQRELRTLENFNYEIEKNEVLKSLFDVGYRNKDRVYALLFEYAKGYEGKEAEIKFHQFWLGRAKYPEIVNDLNRIVNLINAQ